MLSQPADISSFHLKSVFLANFDISNFHLVTLLN